MGIIRTFKCKFNDRVTSDNRDGVIQSLINQFGGLGAEPEVTLDGDTFSLTLSLSDELTPTMVRDKLAWNYFIDRVTTGDSIRKIKVMRMPKALKEVEGDGKGQLDGIARDTGVDEVLLEDGKQQPQTEYKIDMGDRTDGPPVRRRTPAVFGLGMSRGGSKFAHHSDLSHPVPGSIEELFDHMENHHPDEVARLVAKANSIDPGQTWSKMKENFFRKFNNQGQPQDVFDELSDDHLSKVHPDGKEAGDHPHTHGNDLNIDIPDIVPQEISTPKELTVVSSWVKKSHNDIHPEPIDNNEALEHIISHHTDLVDHLARNTGHLREEVIERLRNGDIRPSKNHLEMHKILFHENNYSDSTAHFNNDSQPLPITDAGAVEHIISHHPDLVDHLARNERRPREEIIERLRTGDLNPAGGTLEMHKTYLHENYRGSLDHSHYSGSPDHSHDHSHEELVVNLPDTFNPTASSWVKQADPGSLRNEGQAFTHEPDSVMGPEDLDSMATDVTKLPPSFGSIRKATENDAGGSQFGQPFDRKTVMDSVNRAPQESRGPKVTVFNSGSSPTRATGGPIPFSSWFSEVGSESTIPAKEDTKAPLDFTASLKGLKGESEDIDSAIELPEATQGGAVLGLEGWFSASLHFGYDDGDSDDDGTYDYSEDNDKDED